MRHDTKEGEEGVLLRNKMDKEIASPINAALFNQGAKAQIQIMNSKGTLVVQLHVMSVRIRFWAMARDVSWAG
jgi:hypothetical protein